MKKIKILILTCSLNLGGAERQIYNLVSNIDKRKYDFVIVCLYELGEIGEQLLNNDKNINIYNNLMINKIDVLGVFKLLRIMKNEDIDVLFIVHTPLTLFWGILCARLAGIRVSLTRFTSTNPSRHVKRRKIVNFLSLPFIDKIIAQAYSHGKYLVNVEGVDSNKVVVINNCVNLKDIGKHTVDSYLRQTLGIPLKVPIVGIVANLRREKGHKVFLEAAKKVLGLYPQTNFLIVGDGEERNILEKISIDLDILSNVHFFGKRTDVYQIISLFDVAVLASSPRVETFSNAIFEYMASSKPVVATNVGSVAEQVINGETGFLIPYDDPDAMANAILKLLQNIELSKKMGQAGRQRVENIFSVDRMIAEYDSLFTDLLKKKYFKANNNEGDQC